MGGVRALQRGRVLRRHLPLLVPLLLYRKVCLPGLVHGPTSSNGSILIYTRIVRPVFLKNEGKIDDAMKIVKDKASEAADKFKDEAKRATANIMSRRRRASKGGGSDLTGEMLPCLFLRTVLKSESLCHMFHGKPFTYLTLPSAGL
ncbi:hypothetical protein F7725_015218 [Dissostichus mawsoni]|uniref:Uncharacterized protein n=1 Tax=Dissostichus mawsoni TaxID=36200 RepID=A0A7J5YIB8_DISMA|nr:hypothetical protein F7725_015218 [Dissostichus mawsoni]